MWKLGIWAQQEIKSLQETWSSLPPWLLQESEGFAVGEIKAVLPSEALERKIQLLRAFTDLRETGSHQLNCKELLWSKLFRHDESASCLVRHAISG